jgi:serine/threonine-protein kinase
VAERYLIHELLGIGGMGEVYLAEHIHMKKRVALKVLHGALSRQDDVVKRFEREAVAAARINHPSVITATDFGPLSGGSFYLVLELIEGVSLSEELTRLGKLDVQRTFGILFQITAALEAAHAAKIVHRDLKPDNVMLVASADGEDYVKVLDFGIAKLQSDVKAKESGPALTRAGAIFGTPEYMAPEQAQGYDVDERADLYALGMIGYELLTGRTAFHDEDTLTVLRGQILSAPAPLPSEVHAPFANLIMRLLEKDPAKRPGSAPEVLKELFTIAEEEGWPIPEPKTRVGTKIDLRASRGYVAPGFSLNPGKLVLGQLQSIRSLSMLPVRLGPKRVPLWLPLIALVLGLILGGVLIRGSSTVETVEAKPVQNAEPPWPSLEAAANGDRDVLGELRKRLHAATPESDAALTPDKRKLFADSYFALGRGLTKVRLSTAALSAYASGIRLDRGRANHPALLLDVAVAIDDREAFEAALQFLIDELGSSGPDVLYDALRRARAKSASSATIARLQKALRSPAVRGKASPEILAILELEKSKYCAEYRQVLNQSEVHWDGRSLAKLESLSVTRGCGRKGTEDCFRCLRDSSTLADAIAKARATAGPVLPQPN